MIMKECVWKSLWCWRAMYFGTSARLPGLRVGLLCWLLFPQLKQPEHNRETVTPQSQSKTGSLICVSNEQSCSQRRQKQLAVALFLFCIGLLERGVVTVNDDGSLPLWTWYRVCRVDKFCVSSTNLSRACPPTTCYYYAADTSLPRAKLSEEDDAPNKIGYVYHSYVHFPVARTP